MASVQPTIRLKPELSLLVSLAHETSFHRHGSLSEELFRPEAVATALSIDEGSTFAVSRKQVPKLVALTHRVESNGVIITHQQTQTGPPLPEWVIYKVAQIEFTDDGHAIPDHRHRLAAALVEFLVLTHDPVIRHPFLPSLYGFAWSQNRYLSQQRIPVPVLDWADNGSLAAYQAGGGALTEGQRKRLIWEVGTALAFLHACEIFHGDVKTENVLLYRTSDGGFTAKVTDFGMSVVSQHGYLRYLPPGTLPWTAPEVRWVRSPNVELDKADVFSFGLLAWRVYCDGCDPLSRLFLAQQLSIPSAFGGDTDPRPLLVRPDEDELQNLFEQNRLMAIASSFYWKTNLAFLYFANIKDLEEPVRNAALQFIRRAQETAVSSLTATLTLPFLVDIFQNTLSTAPSGRNLGACLAALEENETFQRPLTVPKTIQSVNARRLHSATTNSNPISWLAMRHLDPRVTDFVMCHRLYRAAVDDLPNTILTGLHLGNAACLLGGMGTDRYTNVDEALAMIAVAARRDNYEAGAILYRVHNAFSQDVPEDIDCVAKCQRGAYLGSVAAFEDLRTIAGELLNATRWTLTFQTCGIGADFFFDHQCLNRWSFAHRNRLDWIRPALHAADGHPQTLRVNKRGDNFLHAAVSLKLDWLLPTLLDEYKFDVDFPNDEGETPLLCAIRAASVPIAIQLLDLKANPCITSNHGESPLHWLICSTELGYQPLINKIIAKGGLQTITCWAKRCDYAAVLISSFHHYSERLCDGTPLHWAICRKKAYLTRLLIEQGAPLDFRGPRDQFSAIELAAYLHEADILRFLIAKQAEVEIMREAEAKTRGAEDSDAAGSTGVPTPRNPIWGGARIIRAAVDGSDRYSLLIRHGDRYKSFSRRTFHRLGHEFRRIVPIRGIDGEGRTALHYAARGGYDEAVELILIYLNGERDINTPYGNEGWTPICEAIRRDHGGLFDLLLKHGAKVNVNVDSPGQQGRKDWGLLHIAARFVIGDNLRIATRLLESGLPVDGYGIADDPPESPLSLAIENDAFDFSDLLRKSNADINARSRYLLGGSIRLSQPVSILGRVIASNMRYSKHRLHYLLYPPASVRELPQAEFIILPDLGFTALHWSLVYHSFLESKQLLDVPTRIEIFQILLDKYDSPDELNARERKFGSTALHMAVTFCIVPIVRLLVDEPGGADVDIQDSAGKTALDYAKLQESQMLSPGSGQQQDVKGLTSIREIIDLLEEARAQF